MLDSFKNINQQQPEKGKILISEPFLEDEYFKRSVILLCEMNEEGAFGFILNNQVKIELNELIEDVTADGFRVSLGGPVQTGNLYYLHTLGDQLPGSIEVVDGLFMGGEFELLKSKLETGAITEDQIRFFLGYSGWSPGQLEGEMEGDSWIVSSTNRMDVMSARDKNFWKEVLKNMGGKFSVIANFPENPTLN